MDCTNILLSEIKEKEDLKYIILSSEFFNECAGLFSQDGTDFSQWYLKEDRNVLVYILNSFKGDECLLLTENDILLLKKDLDAFESNIINKVNS